MEIEDYPITVYRVVEEDDEPYWMAYMADIGQAACSAVGDTPQEAIDELREVWKEVRVYYEDQGIDIPAPFTTMFKFF